ncbi:hypothetical protein HYDPIDRAFT_118148 [Hydnomerulius pinastri MD-312]|uniref:F-box domain-containing protein n=1 Tax=Hydnomerulius pinastri MD-312 TaxID=994086 RepID=A0A0C9V3A0_9AGAM|nr:hypothetical protein HYDPIDRAFT_118148 [Hydnomerulius pinastri MD-312]
MPVFRRWSVERKARFIDPLNVLPAELVGDIFYLWLLNELYPHPQYSHSQLPTLLCRVSKSWRDFVYTSPLLWAHVVIEASQGAVPSLQVLKERLARSQSAPLFVEIVVGDHPDKEALRVLFAQCSRFRHLTLGVLNLSWWEDAPMDSFAQLRKLSVRTWTRPGLLVHEDELSSLFKSAPLLRHVNWHSTADPGPVAVNGSKLLFLDLLAFRVPITRVLEVLEACPNLRNVTISFMDESEQVPTPLSQPIVLHGLRSLYLYGSRHLACLLESVQAPLLSSFEIHWARYNGGACGLKALQTLLAYSPHLTDLALHEFLQSEDGLISIITDHSRLSRLVVTAEPDQKKLITNKTFELLTRGDKESCTLPQLEELVFRGGLYVQDDGILGMIESRRGPLKDVTYSSGSQRACGLRSICLDRCRPMELKAISRLETICQEGELKADGAFMSRTQSRFFSTY